MKLIGKYLGMYFKSQLEYKSSFILTCIAQLLTLSLSSFMVFILMDKFHFLDNYDIYELMLGISIVQFGFSFSECFMRGFDKFSEVIKVGGLDLMLIRPRNIYVQVFGSNIELTKLSRVLGSLVLFIIAISNIDSITWYGVLYLFLLLVGSSMIYAALFIFSACFCFKTVEGLEFMNIFTDGSREFGQYPMGLFRREVILVFTFLIPLACVNYYPISYILGKSDNIWYLISPLMTFILFIMSIITFNRCIRHYEGTGS
jgi:hypothetical protein